MYTKKSINLTLCCYVHIYNYVFKAIFHEHFNVRRVHLSDYKLTLHCCSYLGPLRFNYCRQNVNGWLRSQSIKTEPNEYWNMHSTKGTRTATSTTTWRVCTVCTVLCTICALFVHTSLSWSLYKTFYAMLCLLLLREVHTKCYITNWCRGISSNTSRRDMADWRVWTWIKQPVFD